MKGEHESGWKNLVSPLNHQEQVADPVIAFNEEIIEGEEEDHDEEEREEGEDGGVEDAEGGRDGQGSSQEEAVEEKSEPNGSRVTDEMLGAPSGGEDGEEGITSKGLAAPARVSKEEQEEHERTHTPYRSWCEFCVKGRGRKMAHRAMTEEEKEEEARSRVPRVSLDYFYMSQADEDACANPILIMVDESTGEKYARAAGSKGLTGEDSSQWLVRDIAAELRSWGHAGGVAGKIILKCDNESSIKALRDAVGRHHGGVVIPEHPAAKESQSNGVVEQVVQTVRGFCIVLKEQLEAKAGTKVTSDSSILQWVVRWAAMLCSRFLVGRDGQTPFERRRGRRCTQHVVPFGEKVWHREIRHSKERKNKLTSEEKEGIWLGHNRGSNEVLVGTANGVVRAYAVRRQPEGSRWGRDMILDAQGTPPQPVLVPIRINFDAPNGDEATVPREPLRQGADVERMRITPGMFAERGYTDGCAGCRHKRAGFEGPKGHPEACRRRIRSALAESQSGRQALTREEERLDRRLADWVEEVAEKEPGDEDGRKERPEDGMEIESNAEKEVQESLGQVGDHKKMQKEKTIMEKAGLGSIPISIGGGTEGMTIAKKVPTHDDDNLRSQGFLPAKPAPRIQCHGRH